MARIAVLQHFWCEHAGIYAEELTALGHQLCPVRLDAGEPLPVPDDFSAWLVMGGPMNVDELERYAWLAPERELLAVLIARDAPVLGVCLGAQLLARAAGARVYAKRPKEIGVFDLELTASGRADPLLSQLQASPRVFQWHGDTFDLPVGAAHLAGSARFEQQAFRMGRRVYGLQFHLESTPEMVATMARCFAAELAELPPSEGLGDPAALQLALDVQNEVAPRMIRRFGLLI